MTEDPEKLPRLKVEEQLERYRRREERVEAINKLLTTPEFMEKFTRLLRETNEKLKLKKLRVGKTIYTKLKRLVPHTTAPLTSS